MLQSALPPHIIVIIFMYLYNALTLTALIYIYIYMQILRKAAKIRKKSREIPEELSLSNGRVYLLNESAF